MKVAVFGLGYVGSVTAACLARDGHRVVGVDIHPRKVELIGAGRSPVIEAGLDEMIQQAVAAGRLEATVDGPGAARESDIILVCVGTPSNANGSLNLHYVQNVCREVGSALANQCGGYRVVVIRSTVLPGTVRTQLLPLLEATSHQRAGQDFGLCMNPEFLREGSAVHDYDHSSHIVIGQLDSRSGDGCLPMYESLAAPLVRTSLETAEMVKYVSNAFHAVKVAFANEIGNLCKLEGVDGRAVMEIFCQDRRLNISPAYLKPGFAFGGSCLPKDLRALLYQTRHRDLDAPLLEAVLLSNQRQVERGIRLIEQTGRKRIGVLGLSFKSGTDDVRESPVVPLVETLVGRGYVVKVHDEQVDPGQLMGANRLFLERELPHIASLMSPTVHEVLRPAEVVVIANANPRYRDVPALLNGDQLLIDLVGVTAVGQPNRGSYEGICW